MCGSEQFDSLYVTVRRDKKDDLVRYYRTFGWETVKTEERNEILLNMEFRRPHKIAEKDDLQLLQVYLENALNTVGRLERLPRPHTLAFGLVFSLLGAGLIAAGCCLVFLLNTVLYAIVGWILVGFGAAGLLFAAAGVAKLYPIEGRVADAKRKVAKAEIERVCEAAERLTCGWEDDYEQ